MKLKLLFSLLFCSGISQAQDFVFKGRILHPSSDTIFVYSSSATGARSNSLLGKAKLNTYGSFKMKGKIEVATKITISYGGETTNGYLSPGDELVFGLDTEQFDETVQYSGKGNEINNFISKTYLHFENAETQLNQKMMIAVSDSVGNDTKIFLNNLDSFYTAYQTWLGKFNLHPYFQFYGYEKLQTLSQMYSTKSYYVKKMDFMEIFKNIDDELGKNNLLLNNEQAISDNNYNNFIQSYYQLKQSQLSFQNKSVYEKDKNRMYKEHWDVYQSIQSPLIKSFLRSEFLNDNMGSTRAINYVKPFIEQYISGTKDLYSSTLSKNYKKKLEVSAGVKAPDFSFKSSDGKIYTMKDFKDKYLFIDIWATWCGPCKREIPYLRKIVNEYKDKNIIFVSIAIDEKEEVWTKFLQKEETSWLQLWTQGNFNSDIVKKYNVPYIPYFVLVNPQGIIEDINSYRPSIDLGEKLDQIISTGKN